MTTFSNGVGTPSLFKDYYGTEDANMEPSEGFWDRLSRCYELAAWAVLYGDLGDGSIVHGSWHGPGAPQRIGHAWVLLATDPGEPAQIWEPITAEVFDAETFYEWTNAEPERTYTAQAAARQMVKSGHFGRWHKSLWP
jgi:hypothetical protein